MDKEYLKSLLNDMMDNPHIEILEEIYCYFKSNSEYYNVDKEDYDKYLFFIYFAEKLLNGYIVPDYYELPIKENILFHNFYEQNAVKLLNYVINNTLKYIMDKFKKYDIATFDVTNMCLLASLKVNELCKYANIENMSFKIEPGYTSKYNIGDGCMFHYFNILKINGSSYLVDTTYRQFFKENHNSIERLGIPLLTGIYPGYYMLLDNERKKVAETLLRQGYIKLEKDTLKHYLDGFTLYYRNGLYYEDGLSDFRDLYSVDEYISFLDEDDSILNYENVECLGVQKRTLKRNVNFKAL